MPARRAIAPGKENPYLCKHTPGSSFCRILKNFAMSNKGIVFIHGAGLGSYIWEEVRPLLKYPSMAVNFPNRHRDKANEKLSLNDYCRHLIKRIKKWDVQHLIIVAHSIGGVVALKLAEHFDDRVAGFVGVSAAIPKNGGSYASCLPFPQRLIMPLMLRIAGTKPPANSIAKALCNDLTDEQTDQVIHKFTAEARRLYTDRCEAGLPRAKRMYIKLTRDQAGSIAVQERMARNLQADRLETIRSGHLVMMSHPQELASLLNDFTNEIKPVGISEFPRLRKRA